MKDKPLPELRTDEGAQSRLKEIADEVSGWPGVSTCAHRFGGLEFRVGKREVGHLHDFGIVDIPFTVPIRDAIIRAGWAERHHVLPDSGWTTVRINKHGKDTALMLLRLSYLRIGLKADDPSVADQAWRELERIGLEPEVLEVLRESLRAARWAV